MRQESLLQLLASGERMLACSPEGRVMQTTDSLNALLGYDPTGKALGDILGDDAASALLEGGLRGETAEAVCSLNGRDYLCAAKLSAGGSVFVGMSEYSAARRSKRDRLLRYFSSHVAANTDNISLVLGGFKAGHRMTPAALALIQKSLYDLSRVSRDIDTIVSGGDGPETLRLTYGDIAADTAQLMARAAMFCEGFAQIVYDPLVEHLLCDYDPLVLRRVLLNLTSHCIAGSREVLPRLSVRGEVRDNMFSVTFHAVGPRRPESDPLQFDDGTGETVLELEVANVLMHAHGGSVITAPAGDGGRLLRASFPLAESEPTALFSSDRTDWYGGADIVAVELSGALPLEAYMREEGVEP